MKNMNEDVTMVERIKIKAAEILSDVMIKQADAGTRNSGVLYISEPVVPIELLKEKME